MGWNGAGAVGAGKAAPPPSHPAWPPAQRPPSAQMAPHLSRQRGRGAGGAVPGGGGGGGPGRARCGARGAEGLCPPAPSRHPRGAPGDSCRIPLLGAGGVPYPTPLPPPPTLRDPLPTAGPDLPAPPAAVRHVGPRGAGGRAGGAGGGAGAAAGRGGPAPPAHVLSLSRPRRYCRSGPGLRHGAPAAARLPARPALRQGKGWGRGMGGTAVVLGGAVGWGLRSPGPHGCTFPGAAGMGFWGHCGISHPVGRRIMRWDWGGGLGITPLPSAPSPPQRCCRTPRTPLPVWSSSIWPQP